MTLRELASLANVSVSTISKAFSNAKGVSKETREHIFQIAREHGCYEQFHKGKYFKKLIAVICPEIKSEAYHRMASYLETLITEMGATMILSISNFDAATEESLFSYHAYYQKVDGIIIIGQSAEIKDDPAVPTVRIGASGQDSLSSISVTSKSAIEEAVKHLMELGHRRIGFIGEHLTRAKAKRFRDAMHKYALPIREEYIIMSEERFEIAGYHSMETLLALPKPPTAVIFAYDYMALGAKKCIQDHGLSVPDDISLIGMDNIHSLPYWDTPLTTISNHYKTQCKFAWDILQKKMENKYYSEHSVLEATLIKRDSVKDLKK